MWPRPRFGPGLTSSAVATLNAWISLRGGSGFERGIIGVSLGAAAVEGGVVERIERRAALEALDEIGIGNEQFPERNQVGFVGRQHLVGEFEAIAVVGVVGALEAVRHAAIAE